MRLADLVGISETPSVIEACPRLVRYVETVELVAHRAGNSAEAAAAAHELVDMIELDVHVLRGRVEVRHAKVLRPTSRLWEKWYLLPAGSAGVPIETILAELPPSIPLMIDLKCFTARSSRMILDTLPAIAPVVASTRNWWTLRPFRGRSNTRVLRSCGTRWQLWWVLHLSRFRNTEGVCVNEQRLTREIIDALHERTPLIFSWGVETTQRAVELAQAGLTGIIADDYELVRAAL